MARKIIGRCLLQSLLNRKGINQLQFSIITGITPSQISEYITGNRAMTLNNAKIIAIKLNCNIDDLYEWKRLD
jgi:putative transcriptional regulator